MLDEAAQVNAEWEEASGEFEFLCQECMARVVEVLDFVGDGDEVPEDDILAAFPGGRTKNELLKLEAATMRHHMLHGPKNPFCPGCQAAKGPRRRRPSRKRTKSEKASRP